VGTIPSKRASDSCTTLYLGMGHKKYHKFRQCYTLFARKSTRGGS